MFCKQLMILGLITLPLNDLFLGYLWKKPIKKWVSFDTDTFE